MEEHFEQPPFSARVGDDEREASVTALREHVAAGRLTPDEFSDRMAAALSARTEGDLNALFVDLPGGRLGKALVPAQATWYPTTSPQPRSAQIARVASALAWPVTLMVLFATGWQWWWLIFIPIFLVPTLVRKMSAQPSSRRQRPEQPPKDLR